MIKAEKIEVVFGRGTPLEKKALNGVSLTIEQGSFVTVIGSIVAALATNVTMPRRPRRPRLPGSARGLLRPAVDRGKPGARLYARPDPRPGAGTVGQAPRLFP